MDNCYNTGNCEYSVPGDYNSDGSYTVADLTGFFGQIGSEGSNLIGDLNGDGIVTSADLTIFLTLFGTTY